MESVESLLSEQRELLNCQERGDLNWQTSYLLGENELIQAAYALISKGHEGNAYRPEFFPSLSGAIPLFGKCFFPWGALPYPKEHADLGALLTHYGEYDLLVKNMLSYQEATLDHDRAPIFSFFQQEGRGSYQALEAANALFFKANQYTPAENLNFVDEEIGIISQRDRQRSLTAFATGCKSGMGTFLSQDVGILNYGPQLLPIGNCAGFGIAGRGEKIVIERGDSAFSLSYQCRVAAPTIRAKTYYNLSDSGYSALWVEGSVKGNLEKIVVEASFEGPRSLDDLRFTFFGKGEICSVGGTHQLKPRSLDRYAGPAELLYLNSRRASLLLQPQKGFSHMEIIPLAGDESFWGADFLIAFTLNSSKINFALSSLLI